MTGRIPQDPKKDFTVTGMFTLTYINEELLEEYMARRIPQDPSYHTACPAAIKAKITALENAAFCYGYMKADYDTTVHLQDAQAARYNLERTILTCIENAVAEAYQTVQRHAAYHVEEIEGCLDEYEDTPCRSLLERLRGAINKAKATFK
jgi:hypothetical protein